jgi:hypothetical protein
MVIAPFQELWNRYASSLLIRFNHIEIGSKTPSPPGGFLLSRWTVQSDAKTVPVKRIGSSRKLEKDPETGKQSGCTSLP